jgi:Septum formation
MAAPAGVGSGSAPESAASEPAVTEPVTLEPVTLEPVETEPLALDAAVPEPSRPGPGESVAAEAQTGERRGVSRLAAAGVIVVLVAVVAAAGVLVVATHGFRHKTVVTYRPAAVFSLRAGDCINSSPNGLSVTILSCATPHEAEVFATFSLTGSSWPGEAAVQQQASSGCANRIASYLNPQLLTAGLTQQYVYPNQDAWQASVRTVVCEVSSPSGTLSGSVRNSG